MSANDLQKEIIILIGDSQMVGEENWRKSRWGNNHMGPQLERILAERGAKVVRISRGASGVHFWIKTLRGEYSGKLQTKKTKAWTLDFLRKQKPTQIIVSLGGNDSGRGHKYFKYYAGPLMKELKHLTSNVTWFGPGPGRNKRSHRYRTRADKALQEIAIQAKVIYISMLDWVSKDSRLKGLSPKQIRYDGIHYKDFPAKCYAEAIAKNIRTTL